MTILEAALEYAARGWSILPIWWTSTDVCGCPRAGACRAPGKHPLTPHGVTDATTDEARIRAWWTSWPLANVAIATGDLVVIDIDGPEGAASMAEWGALPQTRTIRSPRTGGVHLYYTAAEIRSGHQLGPRVDVKATGGYVLAPPSSVFGAAYALIEDRDPAPLPDHLLDQLRTSPRLTPLRRAVEAIRLAGEGERNDALNREAFALGITGLDTRFIAAHLRPAAAEAGLAAEETDRTLRSAAEGAARHRERDGQANERPRRPSLDDQLQAFLRVHGDRLRWCEEEKTWYVCDADTGYWSPQDREGAQAAAKGTLREVWPAYTWGDVTSLMSVVRDELAIRTSDLDPDPMVMGTATGVLDLRARQLREIRGDDLMTRYSSAIYDPPNAAELAARAWHLLVQITDGDEVLASFIKRAMGYSLTGLTSEECIFILRGRTLSGKSTLLDGLAAAMGRYATATQVSSFMQAKDAVTRYSMARLRGVRLVTASEAERGQWLDVSLVKQMTSDEVEARHPGVRAFVYRPQFKVWLGTNHLPRFGDDAALVRRLHVIELNHQFESDPTHKDWMRDPAGGGAAMLALAVEGVGEWLDRGLDAPHLVSDTTEMYAQDENVFGRFFVETFELDSAGKIPARVAYQLFETWAYSQNEKMMTQTAFGIAMRELGHGTQGTGVQRHHPGVKPREVTGDRVHF